MTGLPWEDIHHNPWTLTDAENALRWVLKAMYTAARDLAAKRDTEVDAKHVYEAARRAALFSPDCPKVVRGGYTVADRDAFLDQATADQRRLYDLATAAKEAAQDHLRTLNSQSVVMAALAKTVGQTYAVAGAR